MESGTVIRSSTRRPIISLAVSVVASAAKRPGMVAPPMQSSDDCGDSRGGDGRKRANSICDYTKFVEASLDTPHSYHHRPEKPPPQLLHLLPNDDADVGGDDDDDVTIEYRGRVSSYPRHLFFARRRRRNCLDDRDLNVAR